MCRQPVEYLVPTEILQPVKTVPVIDKLFRPDPTLYCYHHHQGNKGGKQGVNRAIISQEPKGSNKILINTILCLSSVITHECASRDFVGNSKHYILKRFLMKCSKFLPMLSRRLSSLKALTLRN